MQQPRAPVGKPPAAGQAMGTGAGPGPSRGGHSPARQPRGGAVTPQLRHRSPGAASPLRGLGEERLRQPGDGWLYGGLMKNPTSAALAAKFVLSSAGGCCAVSCTSARGIAGVSSTIHTWLGPSRNHSHSPAASLLRGVMWMQSKGFSWKAPPLTSDCYFSGAQTLSIGLNSAANLSSKPQL